MNLIARKKNQGDQQRINEKINHSEVRIISFGERDGVYSIREALEMAKQEGLDLIEISSKAHPPVCKIMDYSKFKYEKSKQEKKNKKNSKNKPEKEIKFGPNTGDHDFSFKLKNAREFLEKGHRVKAYIQFKGRELAFKEKGELMLLKFAEALTDLGGVDALPKMNGRKMFVTISPKVKK